MIHPDHQYDCRVVPLAVWLIELDICDVVLGCRIRSRRAALGGGMPLYRYLGNPFLTAVENVALWQNLGDFHSGLRAYRRQVLKRIPFERNSDHFVFDTQLLLQAARSGFRLAISLCRCGTFRTLAASTTGEASRTAQARSPLWWRTGWIACRCADLHSSLNASRGRGRRCGAPDAGVEARGRQCRESSAGAGFTPRLGLGRVRSGCAVAARGDGPIVGYHPVGAAACPARLPRERQLGVCKRGVRAGARRGHPLFSPALDAASRSVAAGLSRSNEFSASRTRPCASRQSCFLSSGCSHFTSCYGARRGSRGTAPASRRPRSR
jgi:hypothetical protein